MMENPGILTLIAAGFAVCWFITVLMLRGLRRTQKDKEQQARSLSEQLRQTEMQYSRMIHDRQVRSTFYTGLVDKLPARISDLMAGGDTRELSRQIVDIIVDLFEPSEAAFFTHIPAQKQLVLSHAHGISASKIGNRYQVGAGRPGVVAMKGITMTTRDFLTESTNMKRRLQACPLPECQHDILSPLLHENRVMGVIGMKKMGHTFTPEEQKVFRMIADLGSNALAFSSLLMRYQKMAHQDGLTGLVSKKQFLIMLSDMMMNASIGMQPLSVFMFDLDHFKAYNDRNGHLEGDRLLKELATLILENVRDEDIAARYGGEELVIAFPHLDHKRAVRVGEFLRKKIERYRFPHAEGQPMGIISVSGGVATYPEDGDTSKKLLTTADNRLYAAKNGGRNLVVASDP